MTREDIFDTDADRHPAALPSGTLLRDQFRIGRVLGVGGFGITYLAFDEVLEMVVAVKEYLPNHISVRRDDGEQVQPQTRAGKSDFQFGMERFLQEARTLAKFEDHPNIVRVRSFFEANGTAYLVMNYYRGRTLYEYLMSQQRLMPEEESLYVAHEVLDGLEAAHGEGVLHRDIDPSNIYLADTGRVVLLDFGAARMAVGERTQTLSVMLKRGYAPHEQYYSHGEQGAWTDIYACAATLYRLLTGFKPPEAAGRVPDDNLVPPNELTPTISDASHEAVMQGLSLWPQDRPQTVAEFRDLLPPSPGRSVAGWRPSAEPKTQEMDRPATGAQIQVKTSVPCRLFIDGQEALAVQSGQPRSIDVAPGMHRLRAIRSLPTESGTATVTATEGGGASPAGTSNFSLYSVMWKNTVDVKEGDTSQVDISFDLDGDATEMDPEDMPKRLQEMAGMAEGNGDVNHSSEHRGERRDESTDDPPANDDPDDESTDTSTEGPAGEQAAESDGNADEDGAAANSSAPDAADPSPPPPERLDAHLSSDDVDLQDLSPKRLGGGAAGDSPYAAAAEDGSEAPTTMAMATLLVRSDRDGRLFIGDRRSIALKEGTTTRVQVRPGRHQLQAVESNGHGTWAKKVALVSAAPTSVSIKFSRPAATTERGVDPDEAEGDPADQAPYASRTSDEVERADTNDATSMPVATLLVRSDRDGRLFIGDRRSIALKEGTTSQIQVSPGRHQLWAVESNGHGTWAKKVSLVAAAPTSVSIKFTRPSTSEDGAVPTAEWTRAVESVTDASRSAAQTVTGSIVDLWTDLRMGLAELRATVGRPSVETPRRWVGAAAVLMLAVIGLAVGAWWLLHNRPPTATPHTLHTPGSEVVVDVVGDDTDPDDDPLRLQSVDALPAGIGSASIVDSTSLRLQLSDDFAGQLEVGYTVADPEGETARSSLRVYRPFGSSPPLHVVSQQVAFPQDVAMADLDNDGDQDVLAASYDDRVVWMEHLKDPTAEHGHTYSAPKPLDTNAEGAISVDAADLDGDGDKDVLAAAFRDNRIMWYENRTASSDTASSGEQAAPEPRFADPRIFIGGTSGAMTVRAADLDGDEDADVVAVSRSGNWIGWSENRGQRPDGLPDFSRVKQLGARISGMEDVRLSDLDADGDLDVLVAAYEAGRVLWIENEGDGAFAEPQAVASGVPDPLSVAAADFDGDGDRDVLVGQAGTDRVVWYPHHTPRETEDSVRVFGDARVVATGVPNPESVDAADLDGDDRPDVLTSSFTNDTVTWYANGGDGTDWTPQVLTEGAREAMVARALDLDGDGDRDVLTASQANDTIAWFENRLDRVVVAQADSAAADSTSAPESSRAAADSSELAGR